MEDKYLISQLLISWYDREKRDLPWRRTQDPFAIWVSEIMLQQTRVETVIPYYKKFLKRFPNLEKLAVSDVDDVLAAWSGLGYYRRARFLHAAARQIATEGGEMPSSAEGLKRLPGIGDYTAAAIASIAFGEAVPVLDGNVERILARLLGETGDVKRAAVRKELLQVARELLVADRAGDSNQALMELGAVVCTPKSPRCEVCPWTGRCVAQASGEPEALPTPRVQRARVRLQRTVFVVEARGGTLMFRRPDDRELLAGTWELPSIEGHPATEGECADALAKRYGGVWQVGVERGRVRHSVTYRDLEVSVRSAKLAATELSESDAEAEWIREDEIDQVPLSSLVRKALYV